MLGEEKSGQVYGMGLLPIPKQVYGRTTCRFKDINIATIDGSSADVEIHMLEEIKQLKEHIRNRDKVIDELLINKQGHHGNEEPTKVVMYAFFCNSAVKCTHPLCLFVRQLHIN